MSSLVELTQVAGQANAAKQAKTNRIGSIIGNVFSGIGTTLGGIFGGGSSASAAPVSGSGVWSSGVPVNVGVDSGTKKWITYAGIAAGVLLLVVVVILATKKR